MYTNGFSAMLGVVILAATASLISVSLFYFTDSYSRGELDKIKNPDLISISQLKFLYYTDENIVLYNPYDILEVRESNIYGVVCSSDNVNYTKGSFKINVSSCNSSNNNYLILDTNKGVFRVEIDTS